MNLTTLTAARSGQAVQVTYLPIYLPICELEYGKDEIYYLAP